MSVIIRVHVPYSKVLSNVELKYSMDLISFINQSETDQWTGTYIENGERWLWADINTRSPEINEAFIMKFINTFDAKVFNYPYFIGMTYSKLNQPIPSYIPNSIKTYSNLINWSGNPNEMPSDKGDPIYKTWVEYFAGTHNDIMCNTDKTIAYVSNNLWINVDNAPIIKSLLIDAYTFVDIPEYLVLRDSCEMFNSLSTLEEIQIAKETCLNPTLRPI